jgi:hypothetical protein
MPPGKGTGETTTRKRTMFSNPNGEDGAMPTAETLDPLLAKMPSLIGFCSSPISNKHSVYNI